MLLVQKWPFFQLFFLGHIGQENVFYDILEPKNAFLGYKNKKLKNPSFWSNNGNFSNFLFLGNISQENVLYEILEQKNTFQGYKYKNFKKSKIDILPCFWSKNGHFSNFLFLFNIGQKTLFYDILEPKNTFLGYKDNKFKKSKNWHFSSGVNPCFWFKNGHFSNFFFWQYRPGKCFLRYSRTKKRLSRL